MKVVVINSSPNLDKGNTTLVLAPFLQGMSEAGAEVELFHLWQLQINPCRGEFDCWLKTPGQCSYNDDMATLLPQVARADIIVLATPLYYLGMPGPLKNFVDRLLPLMQPVFELRAGHCHHPRREGVSGGKVVLVSSCGMWEMDNFELLLRHAETIAHSLERDFAGALLRPHAPALKSMLDMGMPVSDIFAAAQEAGRQLATEGQMSSETLQGVSRTLLPLDMYVQLANQAFVETLAALN